MPKKCTLTNKNGGYIIYSTILYSHYHLFSPTPIPISPTPMPIFPPPIPVPPSLFPFLQSHSPITIPPSPFSHFLIPIPPSLFLHSHSLIPIFRPLFIHPCFPSASPFPRFPSFSTYLLNKDGKPAARSLCDPRRLEYMGPNAPEAGITASLPSLEKFLKICWKN